MAKKTAKKKKSKSTVKAKKKNTVSRETKKPAAKRKTSKPKTKAKAKKKKTTKKAKATPEQIVTGALNHLNDKIDGKIPKDIKAIVKKLKPKQKLFCELFTKEREFFGNGVESYIEAYDYVGSNASARAMASRLLTKANILEYINYLLEGISLNVANADKQLAFLMIQNSDFKAKLGAIKEFNALQDRIKKASAIHLPPGSNIETININVIGGKE